MPLPSFDEIQSLYDQCRFLDAYEASREVWERPDLVAEADVRELILGGRLAARLGGQKVSRWLLREAHKRAPDDPAVRYYTRYVRRQYDLIGELRQFIAQEDLPTDDPDLRASWLAAHALLWARIRRFSEAHRLLDRAWGIEDDNVWLHCCTSWTLLLEDRWTEALEQAQRAWALSPGMPATADALAQALARLGRLDEAADHLGKAAGAGQSFEVAMMAAWYRLAVAERQGPRRRRKMAAQAAELAEDLPRLAPLADRHTRRAMAWSRLDAAFHLDDHERVREMARELRAPFFQRISANIDANPEGRHRLLPYRPIYQMHDTCLPASVTTVLGGLGVSVDHEALARELTYGGTPAWRIARWATKKGLLVRHFIPTPEIAEALLNAEIPFVVAYEAESSSHAMAVIGWDDAQRTITIHDPAQTRWTRFLLEHIGADEAPYGPQAMAIVPPEREDALAVIPPEAYEPITAWIDYRPAMEESGAEGGRELVQDAEAKWPDHPVTQRLLALHEAERGRSAAALERRQELLRRHPTCLPLRRDMLASVLGLGNRTLILQTLRDIVERRLLPGITANQSWRYPPTTYVARYADYLRFSAETLPRSQQLLRAALRRDPFHPEAVHVLGDVLWQQDRFEDSALPYLIAASLDFHNDHYARAVAEARRRTGNEDDALVFLEERVQRLGEAVEGGGAWITWIQALHDYGRPTRAAEMLEQARRTRPEDPSVAAYAVQFWTELGRWDDAGSALEAVEQSPSRLLYLRAATHYHYQRGDWRTALRLCEDWVSLMPHDLDARDRYLELLACREGREASLKRARQWAAERDDHDDFELLVLEQLDLLALDEQRLELLRRRVERSPEDAWAWRELGHALMSRLESRPPVGRKAIAAELEKVVAECRRTGPDEPGTVVLEARLAEERGAWSEAADMYLRGLDRAPENPYFYDRLWACAAEATVERQREIMQQAEKHLQRTVGHLHTARLVALLVARRFGLAEAEAAVDRWEKQAGQDPELVEARVDLLLHHGRGVRDAQRAMVLVREALERYPYHLDLMLSLAHTHAVLVDQVAEIAVLRKILSWAPRHETARAMLAGVLLRSGEDEEALSVVREGCEVNPLSETLRVQTAGLLWEMQRHEEALAWLRDAIAHLPHSIRLREALVERLMDLGRVDDAVAAARAATEHLPHLAHSWYLLGITLQAAPAAASPQDVEAAFRRALQADAAYSRAADELVVVLGHQHRFEEAQEVLSQQREVEGEVYWIAARTAWLLRRRGRREDAYAQLEDLLQTAPLMEWGWRLFMEWTQEDERWERSRPLLQQVPRALREDPEFAARRLVALQAGGEENVALDRQWEELLQNFPDLLPLHLMRFDVLQEQKREDESKQVLQAIRQHYPTSPFVLARAVAVEPMPEALQAARAVWRQPADDEWWPENAAWDALVAKGEAIAGVMAVLEDVEAGQMLRHEAVGRAMRVPAELSAKPTGCSDPPLWKKKPRRDILERFLLALGKPPWEDAELQAEAVEQLLAVDPKAAQAFYDEHADRCARETPLWQVVGLMLCQQQRFGACREWMRDWRQRPGVRMWAMANYSLALRPVEVLWSEPIALKALESESRDIVETLRHDDTLGYHVFSWAEAALRRGRTDAFLQVVDTFAPVFGPDEQWWLPAKHAALPQVLLCFADLLRSTTDAAAALAAARLLDVVHQAPEAPPWVGRVWRRHYRPRAGALSTLWFRVRYGWARLFHL